MLGLHHKEFHVYPLNVFVQEFYFYFWVSLAQKWNKKHKQLLVKVWRGIHMELLPHWKRGLSIK